MRFGCFVAVLLWLGVASVWTGSLVPLAIGLVLLLGIIAYQGLESEWPLWY